MEKIMKTSKKIVSLICVIAMLLSTLAGCGKEKTESSGSSTDSGFKSLYGDQTSEERLLFAKRNISNVDLEIFWFQSTVREDLRDAIEMYKDLYGGKVEVYHSGWNDRSANLTLLNSAGELPDVLFGFVESDFPKFIEKGFFMDIGTNEFDFSSQYIDKQSIDSILTSGGKTYGIAVKDDPEVIIYNKKYISGLGYDTPYELYKKDNWNWSTMRELAKKLSYDSDNDGVYDHFGFSAWSLKALMVSNNTWPLTSTGTGASLNFDNSAMRAVYQLIYDMSNVDKSIPVGVDMGLSNVADGTIGMYMERPQYITTIAAAGVKAEDLEIAPVPKGDSASEYLSFYSPNCSTISNSCKNKEAALALIECYISVQKQMAEKGPRESYGYTFTEQQQEIMDIVRKNNSVTLIPTGYGQFNTFLNSIFDEIKNGSTVSAAIELYKNQMNNELTTG